MTNRRPPRLIVASVAFVALFLPLAACGGGGSGGGSTNADPGAVAVKDNLFTPATTTVHAGDTVTWSFTGSADHNVTGPGFNSPTQGKGTTYQHTFTDVGDVSYVCTLHQGMKGTIKVVQ
jgi:plastocyanin